MGGSFSSKSKASEENFSDLPDKYFPEFANSVPSLKGKVIAVTGTTSGTGFYAAKLFAQKGATVLLLNRKSNRAAIAEQNIKNEVKDADIRTIECDLMNFDSVRKAASTINREYKDNGIDVLCNNAGIMAFPNEATKDGYDVQMQTNHLSHFLLTKELYPLLEKAAEERGEARIVNHSSMARKGKPLDALYLGPNGGKSELGDDEFDWRKGGRNLRYHQTKLANVVFTFALRDRLKRKGSNVIALCCAPGIATTKLAVSSEIEFPSFMTGACGRWLTGLFMQSSADGAMPLIYCCTAGNLNSGEFFEPYWTFKGVVAKKKVEKKEKVCSDPFARKMLWEESEKAVGNWDL